MAKKMKKKFYDSALSSTGFANLPQNVIMKEYASVDGIYSGELNDTISGIDMQMSADAKGGKKSPKKY